MNPEQLAVVAIEFHERECPDAAAIWLDGINFLLRGFDALGGHEVDAEYKKTMLAMLVGAYNSILCARDLALRGYPSQSLNLLRLPVEQWMGFWYLLNYPRQHERFLSPNRKPPSYSQMLERLTKKHQRGGVEEQAWMKSLHPFSHIDARNVGILMEQGQGGPRYSLGPIEDRQFFEACAMQGVGCLDRILEALDVFRRMEKCEPLIEWQPYRERAKVWMDATIAEHKAS